MSQKKINIIFAVAFTIISILLVSSILVISDLRGSLNSSDGSITNNTSFKISDDTTKVFKKVNESVVTVAIFQNNKIVGNGSGSIIEFKNNKALIITNNHVVNSGNANDIRVLFHDKSEVKAKVIGSDPISDLALLEVKIDFKVNPIAIGDSDKLQEGETVIAIGSPLDIEFKGTVTRGIISGVNRVLDTDTNGDGVADHAMMVIQTDTTINPGNSGGPLINMAGQMIGINTSKISMENFEGMGFAIPSNEAKKIINQLKENGEVKRPKLGISYQALSLMPEYARNQFKIPSTLNEGIFIVEVSKSSAASKAGLKNNDVIFKVNNKNITSISVFTSELFLSKKGDTLKLNIYRDGKEKTVNVVL